MDIMGYFLLTITACSLFYGLIHMAFALQDISYSMKNIKDILENSNTHSEGVRND